jgi:hypothetical protein
MGIMRVVQEEDVNNVEHTSRYDGSKGGALDEEISGGG